MLDTLSAVSQHRVKRPWKAKRNEVMTHSAAVVGKMLLDNIAEEIVYYNDAAISTLATDPELGALTLDLDALMGDYATSFFATPKSQERTPAPDWQKGIF